MTPSAPTAPTKKPRPTLGRNYWRLWWANAVSSTGDGAFAAALPLLAGLPRSRQATTDPEAPRVRLRTQIAAGLHWLTSHRLLRIVAVLLGVSNFAGQTAWCWRRPPSAASSAG